MIPLLILFLVLVWIVLPIWMVVKIVGQKDTNERLDLQINTLHQELDQLRAQLRATIAPVVPPMPGSAPVPATPAPTTLAVSAGTATTAALQPTSPLLQAALPSLPDVRLPAEPLVAPLAAHESPPPFPTAAAAGLPPEVAVPPPIHPALGADNPARTPAPEPRARFNWEQFLGAKGFAWAGGLALFLGAAFFVKYSFEHELIPPEVRVALGFILGLGLLVAGLKISRARYAVLSQTLSATGVVCLYAVTFACNSVYHFAFFGPLATFALMALITATAFMLAVRLEARVVAILGMLGGFLTPVLLSTGKDNPAGLFGYLALLNIGLVAVALHRRWTFLVALGAGGTVIMLAGWAEKFFIAEKALVAVIVCLGFCALFLVAYQVARHLGRAARAITWSAVALPFVAFGFAFFFLGYPPVAARPGLLLTFTLLADVVLLAVAWQDEELPHLHVFAGLTVFTLLAAWTTTRLSVELLPWALAFYLLYAVLHTAFPLVLARYRPESAPTWWSQLFPPLALLLMMGPLFKLDAISLVFWPAILLVDLLAIGVALMTASLSAVGVVLVLTLVATGVWIFRVPVAAVSVPSLLVVVGGFAAVFFAGGIFLARRLGAAARTGRGVQAARVFGEAHAQLPAFAALLPFVLLVMMSQRLALANPSPVFGLALLLVVLVLGLAYVLAVEWLPACALAGVAALEYAWHARHFSPAHPVTPLVWYLGFTAIFALYPFAFRRRFAALTGPWAIASLSGVVHFLVVYRTVVAGWPNDFLGLLPALFAVPPLLSLMVVLKAPTPDDRARLNQLAWFGGAALFFITLIFPVQFDRQWITLGWALEGAALLWLFHRVPHPGLRGTGTLLLVVAFVRLALNPAALGYHERSAVPIFNWYLYTYGTVTACLFLAACLAAPPRERVFGINVVPLFNSLGVVLAFLLLNLEIADYFSPPGRRVLAFELSGNFARDMSYTIGWALFALGLLLASIWKKTKAGRYGAIALLGSAMLKLFFHDLSELGQIYKIIALFALAVIAMAASFAYQRFLPSHEKSRPH